MGDLDWLIDEIDRLRAEVEQLRDLLRDLEWSGTYTAGDEPFDVCPACKAFEGNKHDPECRLWLAIRTA